MPTSSILRAAAPALLGLALSASPALASDPVPAQLSTVALAMPQAMGAPAVLLVQSSRTWDDAYSQGYNDGRLAGGQVDTKEERLYGAAAGCLGSCTGGILVAAIPALIYATQDPEVPRGMLSDPDIEYRRGFETGYAEGAKKERVRDAAVGGAVGMGAGVILVTGTLVALYAGGFAFAVNGF